MFRPFLRFHRDNNYLAYDINNDDSPSSAVSILKLQILSSELHSQTLLKRDTQKMTDIVKGKSSNMGRVFFKACK